ncbi:hypothetical protein ROSINTL182_08818 [Roseburia intestinalis L1-82]|uniref:Uncharacterized protein n=1 Tax=Roseburia intestinalis L1-82 TaxID=536231 RepID=C7GFW1_9FIRM|nr:hypothetical protein ROSINTL182_08818 [Roseburia intestinalis L1-82]
MGSNRKTPQLSRTWRGGRLADNRKSALKEKRKGCPKGQPFSS